MKTKHKSQVVLATWPNRQGYEYFGGNTYSSPGDTCDAVWLSFRLVNPSDKDDYIPYAESEVVSDIGLYVWYSTRGSVQMEFKAHGVHSMGLEKCERMLRTLRKYDKTLSNEPRYGSDAIALAISGALSAIGVRLALEYGSQPDKYVPVGMAVARIAETLTKRLVQLRLNDRTAYPEYEAA